MKPRMTIQKTLVLEALNDLDNHPTALEIYQYIIKKYPTISQATVYRNLNCLVAENKILKIEIPNSAARYDIKNVNHYHLKCDVCGKIFDLEMDYFTELETKITNLKGFKITGHSLVINGICSTCDKKYKEEN